MWLALSGLLVFASATPVVGSERYANARFGYTLDYPSALLTPLPEAANGDGRVLQGVNSRARITVWGGYNSQDETPAQIAQSKSVGCIPGGRKYQTVKSDVLVVSCETSQGVRYSKSLLAADGRLVSFDLTYPKAERAVWDAATSRLSLNLQPTAAASTTAAAAPRLKSLDFRGYRMGMTLAEVRSKIHLEALGGSDFTAVDGDTKYDFGFSPLGSLYRIDATQKLGSFNPDAGTGARLTQQLTQKFGPPDQNQLPGGPAFWTNYARVKLANGSTANREVQSLSVMLQGGVGNRPVELWTKMLDFSVLWADAARQNAEPKAEAEGRVRF
jgi:hypothetical protein